MDHQGGILDISKVGNHYSWLPPEDRRTFTVFYQAFRSDWGGTVNEPGFYWWNTSVSGIPWPHLLHGPFGSSTEAHREAADGRRTWKDRD